jgi:CBS domain-containing protein
MNRIDPSLASGSWVAPSWEHAVVGDAMSAPVIACPPGASLIAIARTMATRHVHAIVVIDDAADPVAWRVVSDRAVAAAGAAAEDRTASDLAEQPREAAEAGWPLDRAARLMAEHGVTHLVVVDPDGRPAGMLSTLDLVGVIAWARG